MALNPISFTEQVVSDFLRYQLTTYPLADADLHAQMRALLRLEESRSTPLRQGPFVSLSRPFKSGATIDELVRGGVLHEGMRIIATYPRVRAHQEIAIRAIHEGETTLVATGTGSGKTECFLYPIISRCLHLTDAGAPPGIVAVLVYPMNALAEDQLDRLRGLLAGRGIPFRDVHRQDPGRGGGRARWERMAAGIARTPTTTRGFAKFAKLGESGSTLASRRARKPRNYAQSPVGRPRIPASTQREAARAFTHPWQGRGPVSRVPPLEFLVFDEAHTFRGAQGAGRPRPASSGAFEPSAGRKPRTSTCVATSATMADPERGPDAAADFGRRFFGVEASRVTLVGEVYDELRWRTIGAPYLAGPSTTTHQKC